MNIWILSEKRTGSSYLCELINYTEKFEDQFKEWYVQFDNRKEITNFYKKPNLPKYCKIHSSVMKTIFGSIQELKNKIGFCKFIHLKRRNLRKMLVSQLLAQKTNMYEIRNKEDYKKWIDLKIKIEKKDFLLAYQEVYGKQQNWSKELISLPKKEIICVYYEDLLENPISEMQRIFNFLEISIDEKTIKFSIEKARNAIIKQNHPMTHELLKKTIQLL